MNVQSNCAHCGAVFQKRKVTSAYCSKQCSGSAQAASRRQAGEPISRFWSNVSKGAANDCWPWTAGTVEGYGRIRFFGKPLGAHVVSYILSSGEVPQGKMVLHRCGNRICCNPGHLYAGDYSNNTKDAVSHGTHVSNFGRGAAHIGSRLDDEKVREIRSALMAGESQRSVAARMGTCQQTISAIHLGETWRHVQ